MRDRRTERQRIQISQGGSHDIRLAVGAQNIDLRRCGRTPAPAAILKDKDERPDDRKKDITILRVRETPEQMPLILVKPPSVDSLSETDALKASRLIFGTIDEHTERQ